MKISAVLCAILAIVVLAAIPASAQYVSGESSKDMWNVRAGVLFPSGSRVDGSPFVLGVEYALPMREKSSEISLSADWTRIKSKPSGLTRTLVPVMINWKIKPDAAKGTGLSFGVGVGAYWASDDIPAMRLDKGGKFAWQVMADYDFTKNYFATVKYMASGHPSDSGLTGLELGYRF